MGSLKSNSNRNFASEPQMMMKDSYLMPELDRIQASRGLILCWPILTGRNIEIFLVWSANIFPPCLGCLTADRLTAGCCSVKSRPGAGILILHLQSPSTPSSPLLCCSRRYPLRIPDPKLTKLVEICKMHGERRHFCCITHIAQLTGMTFLSPEVKYIKYIKTK